MVFRQRSKILITEKFLSRRPAASQMTRRSTHRGRREPVVFRHALSHHACLRQIAEQLISPQHLTAVGASGFHFETSWAGLARFFSTRLGFFGKLASQLLQPARLVPKNLRVARTHSLPAVKRTIDSWGTNPSEAYRAGTQAFADRAYEQVLFS